MEVKALLRPVYHAYLSFRYGDRAQKILGDYAAHYGEAQAFYRADGHSPNGRLLSPGDVLVHQVGPGSNGGSLLELPPNYSTLIERLSHSVAEKMQYSRYCGFFPSIRSSQLPEMTSQIPEVREGSVIAVQLKSPLETEGLQEVASTLIPQLERKVYGSYVIVDKVYIYRNIVSRQPALKSWRWHYDNHPAGLLKIMIYLSDVTASTGPFEYLRSASGKALLMGASPLLGVNITSQKLNRFKEMGFEPYQATGKKGTTILFNENIVHKANTAREGWRDAIVLQIRPCTFKPGSPIEQHWTGSFEHVDFNPDPYDYTPRPKTTVNGNY